MKRNRKPIDSVKLMGSVHRNRIQSKQRRGNDAKYRVHSSMEVWQLIGVHPPQNSVIKIIILVNSHEVRK